MLRARLATAAVVIPLLLALILYGPDWLLALVVGTLAVVGVAEYAVMAFPARSGERVLTIVLGALVVVGTAYQRDPRMLAAALALALALGLAWTLVARPDFERGLADIGLSMLGILYVGFLLPHFIWLRDINTMGPRWVIFVLAIGMAGDSGGYFVGHWIGRHKLMPRVSPGKTIEGALGIMTASVLVGVVSKLLFLREVSWTEALVLAAVMGVLGQVGDLCESVMKRTFGAKESGWLFPGHGGVLDRIDSLLFPVAFVYYHVAFLR